MEFEGKVWKDPNSSWWLVEVFFLDVMTQGRTRKEALLLVEDAILLLLEDSYASILEKTFKLKVSLYEDGVIGVGATDDRLLFALGLKRQREKCGSSIRDVARRLNSKSPNAYARYERALVRPSLEKCDQLLRAINPKRRPLLVS